MNLPLPSFPFDHHLQACNLPVPLKQHLRPLVQHLTRQARTLQESDAVQRRDRAESKQALLQLLLAGLQLADLSTELEDRSSVVLEKRVKRVGVLHHCRQWQRWRRRHSRRSATG